MAESVGLERPPQGAKRMADADAEIDRLLVAARQAKAAMVEANARMIELATQQGRADAFASVTGSTSLERGATELAALIAELEGRSGGRA
ncbi:MAG: hypothetical protein FJ285_08815 [Planctomycetes bacterium]|nr:hypothetical protein [Planctomycetota bacterium]